MLTGLNQQIITAYEILKLTPEQIYDTMEKQIELTAIKACLMQFSPAFRDTIKKVESSPDNFTDSEKMEAKETIIRLMRSSEDDHLVGRLARYVRDDSKGRLDINAGIRNMNINVNMFNDRLKEARAAKLRSKEPKSPDPAPDIEISACAVVEKP